MPGFGTGARGRTEQAEARVEWWGWLLVVLAVLAVLVAGFVAVQARRRRGGVITRRS